MKNKIFAFIIFALIAIPAYAVDLTQQCAKGATLVNGQCVVPISTAYPSWLTEDAKDRLLKGETVQFDASAIPNIDTAANQHIRPGAWMFFPSWCTFNYVFRNKITGQLAIGVAGHCYAGIPNPYNQRAGLLKITTISDTGKVLLDNVYFGTPITIMNGGMGNDFALIGIDPEYAGMVDPSINVIDGPCGYNKQNSLSSVAFAHYGHGLVIGTGGTPRVGVGNVLNNVVDFNGQAYFGDSGSPIRLQGAGLTTYDMLKAAGIQTHITDVAGVSPSLHVFGTSMNRVFEIIGPNWELVDSPRCKLL